MKRKYQGFTLIELLIVVAIAGVLLALVLPAIAKTRGQANAVSCMNNLRQLALAAFMYADDYNGLIPDTRYESLHPDDPSLVAYIDNDDVYACPVDKRDGLGPEMPSYTYFVSTPDSLRSDDIKLRSENILYIESDMYASAKDDIKLEEHFAVRHDNRTVIVFVDGHSSCFTSGQLHAMLVALFGGGGGSVPVP